MQKAQHDGMFSLWNDSMQNMSAMELQGEADPCGSSPLATADLFALVMTVTQVGEHTREPDGGSSATAVH